MELSLLPLEVHQRILQFFDRNSLVRARLVSRAWNQLACEVLHSQNYSMTLQNCHIRCFTSDFGKSISPFTCYKLRTKELASTKLVNVLIHLANSLQKLEFLHLLESELNSPTTKERFLVNLSRLLTGAHNVRKLKFFGVDYLPLLQAGHSYLNFSRILSVKFSQMHWRVHVRNYTDDAAILDQLSTMHPSLRFKIELSFYAYNPDEFVEIMNFIPKSYEVSLDACLQFLHGESADLSKYHPLFSMNINLRKLSVNWADVYEESIVEHHKDIFAWMMKNTSMLKSFKFVIIRDDWISAGVGNIRFERLQCLTIELGNKYVEGKHGKEKCPLPILHGTKFPCLKTLRLYNNSKKRDTHESGFLCGIFPCVTAVDVCNIHFSALKYSMTCCPKLEHLTLTLPSSKDVTQLLIGFPRLRSLCIKIVNTDKLAIDPSRKLSTSTKKYTTPQWKRIQRKISERQETEQNISRWLKLMKYLRYFDVTCESEEVNWINIISKASIGHDRLILRSLVLELNSQLKTQPNTDQVKVLEGLHDFVRIIW